MRLNFSYICPQTECYIMKAAELNQTKSKLKNWIDQLDSSEIIEFLDGLKDSSTDPKLWDSLSETKKKIIQKGLNDAEEERVVSSQKFWKELKNE